MHHANRIASYSLHKEREPSSALHLHFLTPYGSFLDLVPRYPSARLLAGEVPTRGFKGFWPAVAANLCFA
jgi:hypothetical protein